MEPSDWSSYIDSTDNRESLVVSIRGSKTAKAAAAIAAVGLMLSPAFAAGGPAQGKKRPAAVAVIFDPAPDGTFAIPRFRLAPDPVDGAAPQAGR